MSEQETPKKEEQAAPKKDEGAHLEVESLRAQLKAAEQTRDEYLSLARTSRADFESYQKRASRDLATERRYAQLPLAEDLLGVIDNLERAIAAGRSGRRQGAAGAGRVTGAEPAPRRAAPPRRHAPRSPRPAVRPEPAPGRHAAAQRGPPARTPSCKSSPPAT